MKKQITCILMALALMLGLLPVTALANPESVPVTRAQLAEALYANESLKALIDEAGEGQQTPVFSDIGPVQDGADPCTDQQREAILALAKAGILNGTDPGVFSPADDVTRGEAAVVLWRATGCKSNPTAATVSYTDVGPSDWYTPAIHALTAAGLLKGTGNNLFEPNEPLTNFMLNKLLENYDQNNFSDFGDGVSRIDMLMAAYETYRDSPLLGQVSDDFPSNLTDIAALSPEQQKAVCFFEELGVVKGFRDGAFHPDAAASNLQVARFLKLCSQLDAQDVSLQRKSDGLLLLNLPGGEEPNVRSAEQDIIDEAFAFLEAQGLEVSAAKGNPHAPGLVASLTEWNGALAPTAPSFSPEGGSYAKAQTVSITAEENAQIRYTTDGSAPTQDSPLYTGPISVEQTLTLKAVAVKNSLMSPAASAEYVIGPTLPQPPEAPVFSPEGGRYRKNRQVTITCQTEGADIYYTDDGTDPTQASTPYEAPITLDRALTLKAIAVKDGLDSDVVSAQYTVFSGTSGGTPPADSPGGGSSGSSSGSAGQTQQNPDGSTTTTVTNADGSTIETTANADGSEKVVETASDGSVTTTLTDAGGNKVTTVENTDGSGKTTVDNRDGSGSVTAVSQDGGVQAEVVLTQESLEGAGQQGQAAKLPMPALSAGATPEKAPLVTVSLPGEGSVRVEIPVENPTVSTVAFLVKQDGSCEVVKTCLPTEGGVAVTLSDGDTVAVADNGRAFADVSGDFWGARAIAFAVSRELFSGTGDDTFSPDMPMSRAMILTVLARLEGVDTSGSVWYEAGRQWAVEEGISDGLDLEANLSREQLATLLYRYAGQPDGAGADLSGHPDETQIASYARQAMAWAVQQGLITGMDGGTLAPQGEATRAQVAAILQRFLEKAPA